MAGGRNRIAEAEGTRWQRQKTPDGAAKRKKREVPIGRSKECSGRYRMAEAEAEGLELDGPRRDRV